MVRVREKGIGSESGFTLLETLVALTILAVAMTSLFRAHSNSLRATGIADDMAGARLLAQAVLSEELGNWQGGPRSNNGTAGNYSWQVRIEPETASWSALKSQQAWRLYRINVTVAWAENRQFALNTVKLGARQ